MDNLEILRLKSEGLCCSQIMVRLVLDMLERENQDLVDFSRGLCLGFGSPAGACGILTAGICILAMYMAGDNERIERVRQGFITEFTAMAGGSSVCKEISGGFYPKMDPEKCGSLLAQTHDRLMEILVENGIDPADPDV